MITVSEEHNDLRVDVFLVQAIKDLPSRMFIKRLIDAGRVTVNGNRVKPRDKVSSGDRVEVDIVSEDYPDPRIKPEDVPLDIVYEDDELIALNKPCGIAVHPASGNYGGTLVNALVHHFAALSDVNGERRPGIVHRLDKETSGVILVAKTNLAHARLARQFEKHKVQKKYVALVEGEIQFDEGRITAEIGQHARFHDMRRIVPQGDGKAAVTQYRVIRRSRRMTSVALFPETGRTHQLRLHMRHIGHPILGDDKYGNKASFPRLALHAQAIFFEHPVTREPLEISVPLPGEFLPFL
jgi:23S rRNA pseudouridine1911/1915/1917 synthase